MLYCKHLSCVCYPPFPTGLVSLALVLGRSGNVSLALLVYGRSGYACQHPTLHATSMLGATLRRLCMATEHLSVSGAVHAAVVWLNVTNQKFDQAHVPGSVHRETNTSSSQLSSPCRSLLSVPFFAVLFLAATRHAHIVRHV